jgi:phage/plasmid-like protein (TIGR03299 family)
MAHELEIINGEASFFSVKDTAWHQLGTVIPDNPSFEEAIRLAKLDYEVRVEPAYRRIETPNVRGGAIYQASTRTFLTTRVDTGKQLGHVSQTYRAVQNMDAFAVLKPLVEGGALRLETGGVLREGEDAWLLGQFDGSKFGPNAQEQFIQSNDPVATYAMIRTNHSGRAGILIGETPIRVVCANTLAMAESATGSALCSIRHTGNAEARLVETAQLLFRRVIEDYEVIALEMKRLKATFLDDAMLRQLVLDVAVPDPTRNPKFNPDSPLANHVMQRAESKRNIIVNLWTNGKGHTGDHSAWEAYNAVVEAIDHNKEMWPNQSGVWRAASLQSGVLAETKRRVLNSLLAAVPAPGLELAV